MTDHFAISIVFKVMDLLRVELDTDTMCYVRKPRPIRPPNTLAEVINIDAYRKGNL